ncbi:hypothetical protein [Candidatus Solincola tengchongensis]|uniref:hypothetical protein n=1 Tax=Candidatus Solincola tengchongensis TaxID=2900693 RepID=UPI00257F83A7|nr:hypothetical protein [Candidatus Solincola tengchongensis]
MASGKKWARYLITASLVVTILIALLAFTAAVEAAPGVTVKVSIAPALRVRADGTLQSNIPTTMTWHEEGLLLTVTAR